MRNRSRKKEIRSLKPILALGLAVFLCVAIFFLVLRLEGSPPVFAPDAPMEWVSAEATFSGTFSDPGSGLSRVQVLVFAPGQKENVILDETFPARGFLRSGQEREKAFSVTIKPADLGLSQGAAVVAVRAEDYSLRRWGSGNHFYREFQVIVDTRSPSISMLTRAHYVNQGGAGLAIWRLNEPVKKDGVLVGDHFYPGYSGRFSDPDIHLAFFSVTPDQGRDTPIRVTATDLAGNTGASGLYSHIRAKSFPLDDIQITDSFIERIMPQFETGHPSRPDTTNLDQFLYVNRDRRQADYLELVGAGRDTARTMLWEGVFERLPRASNRAGFGDRRNYLYKGEIVDNQSHLGVDLASTARSPVPAGNTGIVVLAGTVGIYGETVMLDHGYGLYSSYSHLSQISVTKGQTVKKGEIVGVSGSTGLAGGDHLHFAVMVHDSFVDPKEWWDPSWIKNNITSKIRAVEESLIPAPGPVPE